MSSKPTLLSHRRPTYTDAQLTTYLALLFGATHAYADPSVLRAAIASNHPLPALSSLQLAHVAAIPWGSLALHYSPTKRLSLDAEHVFTKLVVRRLGGYCMEMNTLFATVLRSLGVVFYVTGARISNAVAAPEEDPEGFQGW
jgi:hypothetical protein